MRRAAMTSTALSASPSASVSLARTLPPTEVSSLVEKLSFGPPADR